jgi:putative ABC transport system permease protein
MVLLRSFIESTKIAWVALWANKMRAALTTFGIVIGIVSVTTMATLIDGINRSFESSLKMLGTNVLYIQKWPWSFGPEYNWWDFINRRDMEVRYAERLEELSTTAQAVSAIMYEGDVLRFESKSVERAELRGVTPSYAITGAIELQSGRFFSEDDYMRAANYIVIGTDIAEALFEERDPIGQTIKVGGMRFEVIGLLAKQGKFLGLESFDGQSIMPASTFGKMYGFRRFVQIQAKFENEELLAEGEFEFEGLMRRIRSLEPGTPSDFSINKLDMFREQYAVMTGAIYGIGIFLTALSLFVGGIGVMNIMFVSVKERTKEVGIRKAIGAKSREILWQFLTESVVICMFGGLIGVLLSVGTTALVNNLFVAYLSWDTVALAFTICAITGVVFGFLPAWRAAKSDPIESLRYE